jgi:hypothetical protein
MLGPEDDCATNLRNVGKYQSNDKASHPQTTGSTATPLGEQTLATKYFISSQQAYEGRKLTHFANTSPSMKRSLKSDVFFTENINTKSCRISRILWV